MSQSYVTQLYIISKPYIAMVTLIDLPYSGDVYLSVLLLHYELLSSTTVAFHRKLSGELYTAC